MRKYVSFQEQRKEIDALRDTIEGELNRIAITEDPKEVKTEIAFKNRTQLTVTHDLFLESPFFQH